MIINLNVCVSFLMRSGDVHSPSVQNVIKNAARPQNLEAEPFCPLRHYFRFNHICTICPYTTNWVKMSLNLVLMVVHFLLNRLFQVRKVVVASGLKGPVRE